MAFFRCSDRRSINVALVNVGNGSKTDIRIWLNRPRYSLSSSSPVLPLAPFAFSVGQISNPFGIWPVRFRFGCHLPVSNVPREKPGLAANVQGKFGPVDANSQADGRRFQRSVFPGKSLINFALISAGFRRIISEDSGPRMWVKEQRNIEPRNTV